MLILWCAFTLNKIWSRVDGDIYCTSHMNPNNSKPITPWRENLLLNQT